MNLEETILHTIMPFLKDETPVPVAREIVKRLAVLVCPHHENPLASVHPRETDA